MISLIAGVAFTFCWAGIPEAHPDGEPNTIDYCVISEGNKEVVHVEDPFAAPCVDAGKKRFDGADRKFVMECFNEKGSTKSEEVSYGDSPKSTPILGSFSVE